MLEKQVNDGRLAFLEGKYHYDSKQIKSILVDEVPPEIRELISNIMIEKHIENFNEDRDPYLPSSNL